MNLGLGVVLSPRIATLCARRSGDSRSVHSFQKTALTFLRYFRYPKVATLSGANPSRLLLISVLAAVAVATMLPYTPLGRLLRFTPLPISLLSAIVCLTVTYLFLVQAVKFWFYRRHALL